jgi:acetyl-CoA C-acetyltransferase
MGVTAENVAAKWKVTRQDQDALAVASQQRAANAIAKGYFKEQILPIEIKGKGGMVPFDTDEFVRADVSLEGLAKLKPVFDKNGTVTAGNASGINDAAAAVVLMERAAAEARGLKPLGRLVAYAHAGVEPKYMGIGPVPAVRKVLDRAGLSIGDIDVFEVNEAFAAQALAVIRELELPPEKTNPNGSGISLGHPLGATGCILTIKALYELKRTGGRYGLVTMCIGGGQGIAALFEREN